jgi:hypothetical protein
MLLLGTDGTHPPLGPQRDERQLLAAIIARCCVKSSCDTWAPHYGGLGMAGQSHVTMVS